MSGFEIAGAVLGAFPIAVWALEQYRDVAKVVGFWFEIRLEYQKSSNELKYHHLSFVRNLKQLLLPIVADDAQLQRLIADPGGDEWKDPAITSALNSRLQDSYKLYLDIFEEMKVVMDNLNNELAVDVQGIQKAIDDKPGASSPSVNTASKIRGRFNKKNREYQLFRAKFSLSERPRARLFAELQAYNERLEKLVVSSDMVTRLQADRLASKTKGSIVDTAICKFWHHANALYKALQDAWNCNCQQRHCAHFILQHRTSINKEFRLWFAPGAHNDTSPGSWPRLPVKIKMLESAEEVVAVQAPRTLATSQNSSKTPRRGGMAGKGNGQAVGRTGVSSGPQVTQRVNTVPRLVVTLAAPASTASPAMLQTPSQRITSLCHALTDGIGASQGPECAGYLESEDTRYELYTDDGAANICRDPDQPSISLAQILSGEIRPPLSRRQRYGLSLTLASSFVQLKDTPWLHSSWSKRSVMFSRCETDNGVGALLLDTPFVSRDFTPQTLPPDANNGHDVTGIASLGIVLLELCFGALIEQHPARVRFPTGDDSQINTALDLLAALEWLKEVNDEAGADFAGAIEWCLAGCRTLSGSSDGTWRRQMLEKVVSPLDRCYKYLVSA